jgi:hypothetical protein
VSVGLHFVDHREKVVVVVIIIQSDYLWPLLLLPRSNPPTFFSIVVWPSRLTLVVFAVCRAVINALQVPRSPPGALPRDLFLNVLFCRNPIAFFVGRPLLQEAPAQYCLLWRCLLRNWVGFLVTGVLWPSQPLLSAFVITLVSGTTFLYSLRSFSRSVLCFVSILLS